MGSVYKETYTKPMPVEADLFARKGEQQARWKPKRGKVRTAKVIVGRDGSQRIIIEATTHTAKYRNGSGHVVKIATACTNCRQP